MADYCLECGGELKYDPALKQYICTSCGITYSGQDLLNGRYKLAEQRDTADEERRKRQTEYLKWWLSKK